MNDEILLKRNCEAVLIPAGTKVTLQAGEPVVITQSLGGSYTVIINGNMARIEARDADALGQSPAPVASSDPSDLSGPVRRPKWTRNKFMRNYAPVTIRRYRSTSWTWG